MSKEREEKGRKKKKKGSVFIRKFRGTFNCSTSFDSFKRRERISPKIPKINDGSPNPNPTRTRGYIESAHRKGKRKRG